MHATYNQLVNTNKVAIKNNKILMTQLASLEANIKSLEECLSIQLAIITSMTTIMGDIDDRIVELQTKVIP